MLCHLPQWPCRQFASWETSPEMWMQLAERQGSLYAWHWVRGRCHAIPTPELGNRPPAPPQQSGGLPEDLASCRHRELVMV